MHVVLTLLWRLGLTNRYGASSKPAFRRKLWQLGVVDSSDGFSVWTRYRFSEVHYAEGKRSVVIGSEWLPPRGLFIYETTLGRWEPPHSDEPLTDEERSRIIANVRAALTWEGWQCEQGS